MRKTKLLLLLGAVALLGVVNSCVDSNEFENYKVDGDGVDPSSFFNGGIVFKDTKVSKLDADTDLEIALTTIGEGGFSKIEILDREDTPKVLGDATISGSVATFSTSIFADNDVEPNDDGEVDITIRYTSLTGVINSSDYSIKVQSSGDSTYSKGAVEDRIVYNDTTKQELTFSVFTKAAIVDSAVLMWKKNSSGTWADETSVTYDADKKEFSKINLHELGYKTDYGVVVGDTLYFGTKVTSGDLEDITEFKLPIDPQSAGSEISFTLNGEAGENRYSISEKAPENFETVGELEYSDLYEMKVIDGIEGLDFVKIDDTDEEYYKLGDLSAIYDDYNAASPVTSASGLAVGDVFIYKSTRKVKVKTKEVIKDFYGMIKVKSTTLVDGEKAEVVFGLKEGEVIVPEV